MAELADQPTNDVPRTEARVGRYIASTETEDLWVLHLPKGTPQPAPWRITD